MGHRVIVRLCSTKENFSLLFWYTLLVHLYRKYDVYRIILSLPTYYAFDTARTIRSFIRRKDYFDEKIITVLEDTNNKYLKEKDNVTSTTFKEELFTFFYPISSLILRIFYYSKYNYKRCKK